MPAIREDRIRIAQMTRAATTTPAPARTTRVMIIKHPMFNAGSDDGRAALMAATGRLLSRVRFRKAAVLSTAANV